MDSMFARFGSWRPCSDIRGVQGSTSNCPAVALDPNAPCKSNRHWHLRAGGQSSHRLLQASIRFAVDLDHRGRVLKSEVSRGERRIARRLLSIQMHPANRIGTSTSGPEVRVATSCRARFVLVASAHDRCEQSSASACGAMAYRSGDHRHRTAPEARA